MLITLQSNRGLPVSLNIDSITGVTPDRDDDGIPNKGLCNIHTDFMEWEKALVVKGSVEEITELINNCYQNKPQS